MKFMYACVYMYVHASMYVNKSSKQVDAFVYVFFFKLPSNGQDLKNPSLHNMRFKLPLRLMLKEEYVL